jgi:tetratricopeptide (TPR) repeat protein
MRRARMVSPIFVGAAIAQGVLLEQMGRVDEAREHYEAMMVEHPTEWQLPFRLANLLSTKGQLEEAIPNYQRAIEFAPADQFYPYQGLTSVYYQLNRYPEAIRVLETWLSRNPQDRHGVRGILEELKGSLRTGPAPAPRDTGAAP